MELQTPSGQRDWLNAAPPAIVTVQAKRGNVKAKSYALTALDHAAIYAMSFSTHNDMQDARQEPSSG
jgi:hypothetical protein